MNGFKKRIWSAFLSMTMAATVAPLALAADTVETDSDAILYRLNFDGSDDTSRWWKRGADGKEVKFEDSEIANLVDTEKKATKLDVWDVGSGSWFINFFDAAEDESGNTTYTPMLDLTDKEDIVYEQNLKISTPTTKAFNEKILFIGSEAAYPGAAFNPIISLSTVRSETDETKNELHYGGNMGKAWDMGIEFLNNVKYTIKVNINFKTQKYKITVEGENGDRAQTEYTDFYQYKNVNHIGRIQTVATGGDPSANFEIEYMRLYDNSKLPAVSVSYGDNTALDGAKGLDREFSATATFSEPITQEDLKKISINKGAKLESVLSEDGKTATIAISGLNYREKYTLDIPALSLNGGAMATFITKDDPMYMFRAEFDGLDDTTYWAQFNNNGAFAKMNDFSGNIQEDGTIKFRNTDTGTGWWGAYFLDSDGVSVIPIEGKSNIFVETRFKKTEDNSTNALFTFNATRIADGANLTNNTITIVGTNLSGTDDQGESVGYTVNKNTWYTLRVRLDYKNKKIYYTISDDTGMSQNYVKPFLYGQAAKNLNSIQFLRNTSNGYNCIDYVRVWDGDTIPSPTATLNGEDLNSARRVKNGDTAIVEFPFAITESELSGITLDGNAVEATLSDNGTTATVTIPVTDTRTFHKLQVAEIGQNKAAEFLFRTADEEKYLYRAEFDGNDDDSAFYLENYGNHFKTTNKDAGIADGIFTINGATNHPYKNLSIAFGPMSGEKYTESDGTTVVLPNNTLDCTNKENVKIETRVKWGESGKLNTLQFELGSYIAYIKVDENNVVYYDGSSNMGTAFMVYDTPYTIERSKWYTLTFNMDYKLHRYSVSISDDNGNPANSGTLNFMYNSKTNEIREFDYGFAGPQSATISVDYLRIIDEDFGKAEITYGENSQELENSAIVGIDDNLIISCTDTPATTDGITLKEVGSGNVNINTAISGNTIVLGHDTLKYDTKYRLYVPKNVSGAILDQDITFRTIYNANAEFVYPEGFEQNKFTADDKLNVVFFGGSITNQNGWRVVTSDWFKAKYGEENVNCINASIGGTGAEYGWVRMNRDVVSKNPDIVFVEYSVNDANAKAPGTDIENIVRTLNNLENPPVIIFVYTTFYNFTQNSNSIAEEEKVADYYGIPAVNIRDYLNSLYKTDTEFANDWDAHKYVSTDSTHPTEEGSALYGNYVISLLESNSAKYFKYANKKAIALN